jgi:hypothetical protein
MPLVAQIKEYSFYFVETIIWMISSVYQLVYALGWGYVWVLMCIRLILYSAALTLAWCKIGKAFFATN